MLNIYNNDLLIKDINTIIKELSLSDLIYEVDYAEYRECFSILINPSIKSCNISYK